MGQSVTTIQGRIKHFYLNTENRKLHLIIRLKDCNSKVINAGTPGQGQFSPGQASSRSYKVNYFILHDLDDHDGLIPSATVSQLKYLSLTFQNQSKDSSIKTTVITSPSRLVKH